MSLPEFLSAVSRVNVASRSADAVFRDMLATIDEILPTRVSSLWLYSKQGGDSPVGSLSLACLRSADPHKHADLRRVSQMLDPRDSATGLVLTADTQYYFIHDVRTEPRFQNIYLADEFDLHELLSIRIVADYQTKEATGVLNLYPEQSLHDALPSLTNAIDIIQAQIGICIDRFDQSRKIHCVSRLIQALNTEDPMREYLTEAVRVIADSIDAEGCSIFLTDEQGTSLDLAATTARIPPSDRASYRYPIGTGSTGKVGETGLPFTSMDLSREAVETVFLEVDRKEAKAFIAVPILDAAKRTIGVLRCVQKRGRALPGLVSTFSAKDLEVLHLAAAQIGLIIEIRTADTRRDKILEDMAHEVRTPLAAIRGTAAVLRERIGDRKFNTQYFERRFQDILDSGQLLNMLVDGVAALEEGGAERLPTLIFSDIVFKWLKLLTPLAIEKRMNLRYEGDRVVPRLFLEQRFDQVVFNLLRNAIKYGYSHTDIVVEGRVESGGYALVVRNFGISIPKHAEHLIFLKGYRTQEAMTKDPIGKGLGLAIVKRVVERHGGRVTAQSHHGATEFVVWLPGSLAVE